MVTTTLSEDSDAGAGEGADVEVSVDEVSLDDDDALPSEGGGSGRCSRFVEWQRGHVHSRDLRKESSKSLYISGSRKIDITYNAARRFRSAVGYSTAPTPTAAVPLRGKKPWRPIMAGGGEG